MAETDVENILREIRERVRERQTPVSTGMRSATGNGAGDSDLRRDKETATAEALALIDSYLTTTARAWDRLPPVVSNRSGLSARLELWLKRHLKRATRWYAWEQINFNAAVHHALRDMLQVLSNHERALVKLLAETETRQAELKQQQAEIAGQKTQLSELASELRERDERLLNEQRVCFKQLSLETSEAAVLEDRARRKAEGLLDELRQRVDQLEKK
jgi:hypothetical protein